MEYAIIYFGVISLFSIILTAYDKFASKHIKALRINEKALIITAIIGGAMLMYLTMKIIRHKTKHNKFMIGLPIIVIVQLVLTVIIFNA